MSVPALLTLSLSSVGQTAFEKGCLAARLFIEQMNSDEPMLSKTGLLKPQLMVRESSLRKSFPPMLYGQLALVKSLVQKSHLAG